MSSADDSKAYVNQAADVAGPRPINIIISFRPKNDFPWSDEKIESKILIT